MTQNKAEEQETRQTGYTAFLNGVIVLLLFSFFNVRLQQDEQKKNQTFK